MTYRHFLSPASFEKMFGGLLDSKTFLEIAKYDWSYDVIDQKTSESIILDLLLRIERKDFSIAGQNTERWQKGWQENLDEFRRTGDVAALEPKYLRPSEYLRLDSQFIKPVDPMFERNWYRIFRGWFARHCLGEFDCIAEFGCGSGHNLAFLAQEFPDKYIFGHDWAPASVEIADELRMQFPLVRGLRFDFFRPPVYDVPFPRNTAVLTIGALEQTGTRWRPFLEFLKRTRPAKCFHIEPMVNWYDPESLVDHTAIRIHEARGFWDGFELDGARYVGHRTGFGSLLLEGYSQLQWIPESMDEQARIDALEGAP